MLSNRKDTAQAARRFARALQRTGAQSVHWHHLSSERNDLAELISAFMHGQPIPGGSDSDWAIDDEWGSEPPLSSSLFRSDAVERKSVGPDLRRQLAALVGEGPLEPWPLQTYDAIAVDSYLAAHPELGSGEWLTTENARGERLVFSRAELRQRKAELVIGLDDETNLFRLFVTYNVYRTYSWKPETGAHRLFVRPVGAFLHFPGTDAVSATHAEFALTAFHVTGEDPLAKARQQPPRVAEALTNAQGCLQCHAFAGEGARSHHLRAADGATAGGFALPLAEYPPEVMHDFLFDQDRIAEMFGVGALRVDPLTANELERAIHQ